MINRDRSPALPVVADVRERARARPGREPSHHHFARGIRVEASPVAAERMHFHRTAAGTSEAAPNRIGHRHRLPNGMWTDGASEHWSSAGVARL